MGVGDGGEIEEDVECYVCKGLSRVRCVVKEEIEIEE